MLQLVLLLQRSRIGCGDGCSRDTRINPTTSDYALLLLLLLQ
jgi:hypothetical protein